MNKIPFHYPELQKSVADTSPWDFPKFCPICKAPVVEINGDGAEYMCKGSYRHKPQIQTHTDKLWGNCGYYEEVDRKLMFLVLRFMLVNCNDRETFVKLCNEKLSMPNDYKKEFVAWMEERFEELNTLHLYYKRNIEDYEPRFLCSINIDGKPEFVTDHEEQIDRLKSYHFTQYGTFQFYK